MDTQPSAALEFVSSAPTSIPREIGLDVDMADFRPSLRHSGVLRNHNRGRKPPGFKRRSVTLSCAECRRYI